MDNAKPPGGKSPQPPAGGAGRRARLAAALRDNLRKRKAQARARAALPAGHSAGPPAGDGGEDVASGKQPKSSEHP